MYIQVSVWTDFQFSLLYIKEWNQYFKSVFHSASNGSGFWFPCTLAKTWFLFLFLMTVFLPGVKSCSIMALICVFLATFSISAHTYRKFVYVLERKMDPDSLPTYKLFVLPTSKWCTLCTFDTNSLRSMRDLYKKDLGTCLLWKNYVWMNFFLKQSKHVLTAFSMKVWFENVF